MSMIRKALFRIFRILSGKKGVYGNIGIRNRFTKGVFIAEGSKIGNFNYFGPYSMVNNAKIGNFCSIAPNVKIGQGTHSIDYITTFQKISGELIGHSLFNNPSIIGNDVWCGANVVIMQGVKVGNGAVLGANAVVTNDIPEYAIAVGVPARVIKYRFNTQTIETIRKSEWFNYEIEEAKKIIESLEADIELVKSNEETNYEINK